METGRKFSDKSLARLAASHVMETGLPRYDGQALGDLIVDCVEDPAIREKILERYRDLKALKRRGKL